MRKRLIAVLLLAATALVGANQRRLPKPGFNLFSKDQDVQMGQEYAKQVAQQMQVVPNKDLTDYINRIGRRLVEKGGLEKYPYSFTVVNDPSINAFALPGGPMFVHTGLIKAADNEAQIAGVLAHELSHVVLRHGTNQASKAQLIQLPAMLAGAVAGGSLAGQLAQIGIGLGANSVLLKFSRGAESDADLLGAYTMAKAGYNPIEMARFFEKLEAEAGSSGNSKFAQFLSDHPNPGNRVKAIEDQLPYMARGDYSAQEGDLNKVKSIVQSIPPPAKKPQQQQQQGGGQAVPAPANVSASGNFKTLSGKGYAISYPDNWQAQGNDQSVTIAPREGVVGGGIGYGVIISVVQAPSGKVNLDQDTQTLLKTLAQQNSGMKLVTQPQKSTIGGSEARVTRLSSDSPYANTRETDVVVTIDRGGSLVYMVFVSPEPEYARMEPVFQQMSRSIKFQ